MLHISLVNALTISSWNNVLVYCIYTEVSMYCCKQYLMQNPCILYLKGLQYISHPPKYTHQQHKLLNFKIIVCLIKWQHSTVLPDLRWYEHSLSSCLLGLCIYNKHCKTSFFGIFKNKRWEVAIWVLLIRCMHCLMLQITVPAIVAVLKPFSYFPLIILSEKSKYCDLFLVVRTFYDKASLLQFILETLVFVFLVTF